MIEEFHCFGLAEIGEAVLMTCTAWIFRLLAETVIVHFG